MLKKMSMKELQAFEKKYNLWQFKLFDYPLWIHCREPLWCEGIMVERKVYIPTIINMTQSFFKTLKFLLQQKKYKKVYFLMERDELLEIYRQDQSQNKILFLNPEQAKVYRGNDYIRSDFFNLLRYMSRKIAFVFFYKKYKEMLLHLSTAGDYTELHKYIKNALGDALFLKFLSLIFIKDNKKYYSGSVIPMGEKFINLLNSYEVQHGVIHPNHIGYIAIPKVKNSLIVYSENYKKIMLENGYDGQILIYNYKEAFLNKSTNRHYPIVIYTQPIEKMQISIESFFKKHQPKDIFIQKHPKDYFNYNIDENYFVNSTTPSEVDYPIMYTTTVIENFISCKKRCYIYDLKLSDEKIEKSLNIYTDNIESDMVILDDLEKIYNTIMKHINIKESAL